MSEISHDTSNDIEGEIFCITCKKPSSTKYSRKWQIIGIQSHVWSRYDVSTPDNERTWQPSFHKRYEKGDGRSNT